MQYSGSSTRSSRGTLPSKLAAQGTGLALATLEGILDMHAATDWHQPQAASLRQSRQVPRDPHCVPLRYGSRFLAGITWKSMDKITFTVE